MDDKAELMAEAILMAGEVLAQHLQPNGISAETAIDRLLAYLDDKRVVEAAQAHWDRKGTSRLLSI